MNPSLALLAAVVGYLAGSISFARIVGRIVAPHEDLTKTEIPIPDSEEKVDMGSVSATTVSMHLGPKYGFLTVVLDMLKVALPTLAFRLAYPGKPYFLVAAAMGMAGHIWPVYHRFKGGRGLSAMYGGMFAIDWIGVFATSLLGAFLGMFVFKDVLVAYMGGLWLIIPWLWFRTYDLWHVVYAIVANVFFLLSIIPELRQYIHFRRERKDIDLSVTMQYTAMGRGMYRMAKRFGLFKDKPKSEHDKE
ncbi:MAG: glycerol-3-phosphate acyltransferase [Anaerolineae bacterium]|nr:glycerol-3-phosphate acyltransferase [Anaerolineae bacterium]